MELLESLNDKQIEAVKTTEGYVRVIAGAGSGKTKLLVNRYAYLVLDYGIDPANILCVTFTNKAAGEMKKRIKALIGDGHDTTLICTYHGFCARVLRENPEKLLLNKGFQIIDTSSQKSILEEIYQKYELKLDHASFESVLKQIAKVKRDTGYVVNMLNPRMCQILPDVDTIEAKIIEEFLQRQKAIYALDFHDLINYTIYLLENSEEIRKKWQGRLNYIMVDEFQDSSRKEMRLVEILSEEYKNLMIVGDPDQNIYEWRGSDIKLLVDFDKTHENTATIFLNQNYRSTPEILKCANLLIDKNEIRLKKDLFTKKGKGAEVYHYHSKTDEKENQIIADTIKKLVKSNKYKYSDIAILYRSSFLSRVVEKKLVESGIPYEIYGGVKFFQRMEVLDIIAYLKLIEYDDDISFKRIINTPRRKFGRAKMNALENIRESEISIFMDTERISLFEALKAHANDTPFKNSGASSFVKIIDEIREAKGHLRISDIVSKVCVFSGYEQYIRELGDEERLENLAEFKRIACEFEENFGENLTLDEFLQQISIGSADDGDDSKETVKLMTVHSAKGLEFDVVFIVGLTEGIFPSSKSIEERKKMGLEEERRLCYVAITRAKEHLFLMESEGFSQNGSKKYPSRFLEEIGVENYKRIGLIENELLDESRTKITLEAQNEINEKSIGESVWHHVFGNGTIISKDETKKSYTIKFEKTTATRTISCEYFLRQSATKKPTNILPNQEGVIDTEKEIALMPSKENCDTQPISGLCPYENINGDKKPKEPLPDFEKAEEFAIPLLVRQDKRSGGYPSQFPALQDDEEKLTPKELEALNQNLANAENLWKRDDIPKDGWKCVCVTDLGAPVGVCQMCGHQIIRYVHHMINVKYGGALDVGCVCAGKMEGDIEGAKRREQAFKSKEMRRASFKNKKWKNSQNGNPYLKIKNHIIVLYKRNDGDGWKYSIDNKFSIEVFPTKEEAINGSFEALECMINAQKRGN